MSAGSSNLLTSSILAHKQKNLWKLSIVTQKQKSQKIFYIFFITKSTQKFWLPAQISFYLFQNAIFLTEKIFTLAQKTQSPTTSKKYSNFKFLRKYIYFCLKIEISKNIFIFYLSKKKLYSNKISKFFLYTL